VRRQTLRERRGLTGSVQMTIGESMIGNQANDDVTILGARPQRASVSASKEPSPLPGAFPVVRLSHWNPKTERPLRPCRSLLHEGDIVSPAQIPCVGRAETC
jgi:hypothetical protein